MARQPSWEAVARALATRMRHHAHCEAHPEAQADPDGCPFCADRAAYRLWQAKSGLRHTDRIQKGPATERLRNLDELLKEWTKDEHRDGHLRRGHRQDLC